MAIERLTSSPHQVDLEVRRDGDGRTIAGIAVPFDVETDRGGMLEVFRRGAFTRTIAERGDRVKFLRQHDQTRLLGRATVLREDARGLYAELRAAATPDGDEALELARDGALDLSIGFKRVRAEPNPARRLVEHLEVALYEISGVSFPQYPEAQVLHVRSESQAQAQALTDPTAVDVAAARRRLGIEPLSTFHARRRLWRLTHGD